MSDTYRFATLIALVGAVGLLALLSNRLTERIRIPAPLLVLIAAAVVVAAVPRVHEPPHQLVERLVTLALIGILFDGGLHMGWPRFRTSAAPIVVLGVLATFLTVAAGALFVHFALDLDWFTSILLATAIAPTDPAVVFSVLGKREVDGRSGTILEGESGANDPVGIALMLSLISAGHLDAGAFAHVAGEFALQMVLGALLGILGGRAMLWFMQAVPLPGEGLYPLRTAACALILFGVTTLAHGSGFLAVFLAGIVLGDSRAPYKHEIQRFHSALASLGEIVAFTLLGLTVKLSVLSHPSVWAAGLVVGAVLAIIIRPLAVGVCLLPSGLPTNERWFILFAGLKGAVPILLGTLILAADIPDAQRVYGIVVVVVLFSVLVQGSLVPDVARWLHIPMRTRPLEPWSVGIRLGNDPAGVHRLTVAEGTVAEGIRLDDLPQLPGDASISLVVRNGELLPVGADVRLRCGDELLVVANPEADDELAAALSAIFQSPRPASN